MPHLPSAKAYEAVEKLRRGFIARAGMEPGQYVTLDGELYERIELVYSSLMQELVNNLSALEALDTCKRLYEQHERFLAYVASHKYNAIPDVLHGNAAQFSLQNIQLWMNFSLHTESLRWLIELAVKYCKPAGMKAGHAKMDQLIAMAESLYEWDGAWEYVAHPVLPHMIAIGANHSLTAVPTPHSRRIVETYKRAIEPYQTEMHESWADAAVSSGKTITTEILMEDPLLSALNEPLLLERGYSMEDLLNFAAGMIDSFDAKQYIRVTREAKVSAFLSSRWKLSADRLALILKDFGMSKEQLDASNLSQLLPVERSRRDSRLVRRPVVTLTHNGHKQCIYGVEAFTEAFRIFHERLSAGQMRLHGGNGPLERALGSIQTRLGDNFRDEIARRCREAMFECTIEKDRVLREPIPQGQDFGPVDVFVVDRDSRRFVLVETKDIAVGGFVPRLMKQELDVFLKAKEKLNYQVDWFKQRLEKLKSEYGIATSEQYSVTGVIVVYAPRIWMFCLPEPLPIMSCNEFIDALRRSKDLFTDPVP